jgi:hypothetical protein
LALKLYISYGTAADQIVALRLQALAAVNGLTVYVPPVHTRHLSPASLDPHSELQLHGADVILGVVTAEISDACWKELNVGKTLRKTTIILAAPIVAAELAPYFPGSIVTINPVDPAQAEQAIVQFLKRSEMEKQNQNVLIALGTLALGLLLFAPQD